MPAIIIIFCCLSLFFFLARRADNENVSVALSKAVHTEDKRKIKWNGKKSEDEETKMQSVCELMQTFAMIETMTEDMK